MKFIKFLYSLSISFFICFILNIILTWIAIPYDNKMTLDYLKHRPFWSGTLVLFLLFNVFFFLRKKIYLIISTFIFVLSVGISYISSIKMDKRSDPLIPQDIYLIKESWNMAAKYVDTTQILLFVIGGIFLLLIFFIFLKIKWKSSVAFGLRLIISIICVSSLFILSNINDDETWNKFGVSNKIRTPFHNLQSNGFVMGNFLQLTMMHQQKPKDYSKENTEELITYYQKKQNSLVSRSNTNQIKPNIIVLQLEAFFDPTTLPNVNFSEDPIPFFHSLQNRFTSGKLGVNVFGAGTANTEFEVLTSMSLQLFPYETHPFTSHVNQPMDSVAHQLKKYGYTTSGLHNNVGWFYKREDVYPRLGIDYAMFSDKMKNAEFVYDVPGVPKDYVLFDKIIQRTQETKGKDFVLGITMELHGPYALWYGHDIKATSNVLPQEHVDILEEYAYKINEVDKALNKLINFYENSKEPTMIVMYGDHLPWLGDDRIVYYETGYDDKSESIENHDRMYSTPFLIWDNYRNKGKENINLGSSFLMPYVLEENGIKGNGLHSFLQDKMNDGIYQLPPVNYQQQAGWTKTALQQYQYLQYYYLNEQPSK
ncbi:LTA synthase family protein [Neobacillus sp. SAB-20_R2A]|uniref:LTA synthase family protein n=1 Tax=Neobacillus sp. SAB-20_R2A TaxID=3120519 RepID=UPI003C6DEA91